MSTRGRPVKRRENVDDTVGADAAADLAADPPSRADIAELRRRIADMDDPVRYVVLSDLGSLGKRRRMRLWLDVSSDTYGTSIDQATLFKRESIARALAGAASRERGRGALRIAKITTKGGKRRILRYEPP